jgi:hypothetical protein
MNQNQTSLKPTDAEQPSGKGLDETPCCASSELIGEALWRCATMDEGFARGYRQDAKNCDASDHPEIKKRGPKLIERAEELEKRAAAYREVIQPNK